MLVPMPLRGDSAVAKVDVLRDVEAQQVGRFLEGGILHRPLRVGLLLVIVGCIGNSLL